MAAGSDRESVSTLEDFVSRHAIPATVEVAEGLYATNIDSDFSIGDVIKILPAKHAPRLRGQPPREVDIVTRNGELRRTLPVDWPIFVRPITTGDNDFQHPLCLKELCDRYGQGFPVLVETTEGSFHPRGTAIRIQKGVRLAIHYDVAAKTVLARDDSTKVAIRESFRGVFENRPRTYPTVHDLYVSEMIGKVRAMKTVPVSHPDLDSVFVGDVITPTDKKGRVSCNAEPGKQVEYLLCTREQEKENGQVQVDPVRVPLSMVCAFEEVLDKSQRREFTMRQLFRNGRPELPIQVALVRGDPNFPDKTLAYMSTMTIEGMYDEIYVVASEYDNESPDKPVFEIPLHASLKVKHIVKLYTELDSRVKVKYYPVETLSEEIYLEKRTLVSAYEDIPTAPPIPPRSREGSATLSPSETTQSKQETTQMFSVDDLPPVPRHGSKTPPIPSPRRQQTSLSEDAPHVRGHDHPRAQSLPTVSTLPPKPPKIHIKKGLKKLIKPFKKGLTSPRENPAPKVVATTATDELVDEPVEVQIQAGSERDQAIRSVVQDYRPVPETTRGEISQSVSEIREDYEWIDSSDEDEYLTPVTSPTEPKRSLPSQPMTSSSSQLMTSLTSQLMTSSISQQPTEEGDSDESYETPVTSPTAMQSVEFSDDEDDSSHEYIDVDDTAEFEFGTVGSLKQIPKPAPRHGRDVCRGSTISTASADSGFGDPTAPEKVIPPKDYNIIDFSPQDMTRLLRYFHFSEDTVQCFTDKGIDGQAVLDLTTREMAEEFFMDDFQIKMLSHFIEQTKEKNRLSQSQC